MPVPLVVLSAAAAALVLGVALGASAFRNAQGELTALFALPLGTAVALVGTPALVRLAPRSTGWVVLTLLAWGSTLVLVDAPPRVAYQHLRLTTNHPVHLIAWAILGLQLVAILAAGRGHVRAIVSWCRAHGSLTTVVALFCILLPAAVPSVDLRVYAGEIALSSALQLMSIATLVAAVREAPQSFWAHASEWLTRVLGPESRPGPERIDRWVLRLASGVVAVTAALAWFVYEAHPHVPDEVIYLLHARYLADGLLTMPLPPVPAGFNLDLMHFEATRWYSPVPPGWPMVLALGARIGVPWLVNPVLAGVAVVLTYLLMGRIGNAREARLTTLLLATSPWFLFMSMNFMTHTATLVFALAAAFGVAVARQNGSSLATLLAGFAVGGAALVRPLEGLVTAVLAGFWSLGARGHRFRLAPSAALVAGTLAVGLLDRPYNAALTGSPSEFPIMAYIDKYYTPGSNDLGFGPNRGLGWSGLDPFPGHGPADVVVNAALNTAQWNVELLGWPVGAVVLVTLAFTFGARHRRRSDWWFLAVIVSVVAAHTFYWFSGGPDFGARYWYLIIVPCCALAARGLGILDETPAAQARASAPARTVALLLMLSALVLYVPWRSVGKYRHYRGMRSDVRQLARQHEFGRSIVLVRGERHPDYASAAAYNPVDLRADVPIYVWDVSPEIRANVLNAYPDRTVWIIDGPTRTGNGFRIVAGPLTPAEARATTIPPHSGAPFVYDPVNPPRQGPGSQ